MRIFSVSLLLLACGEPSSSPATQTKAPAPPKGPAAFVGSDSCASCHPEATAAWKGSHHALAMTPPGAAPGGSIERTVDLNGDTLDVHWTADGLTLSSPTEGRFDVPWFLGHTPLRQPLVQRTDGSWQTPTMAFSDAHQAFPLQPGEVTPPGDELHWNGPAYQADHMCLSCHTTGFEKRYDAGTWSSTWAEAAVGCESCHGPSSHHLAWAAAPDDTAPHKGFRFTLAGHAEGAWVMAPGAAIATPKGKSATSGQVEACGACHGRRAPLDYSQIPAGPAPLATYARPSLLEPGLYHPDGRILDEVFVWGSFQQSRMYGAGVVCTDCHDAHSGEVKGGPQAVCSTCHNPGAFDTPAHHHHADPAPQCVDCHMPATTYMEVDPRRDHSFKVPRPARAAALGLATPCTTSCHEGQDAAWAEQASADWSLSETHWDDRWVTAFALDEANAPQPGPHLAAVAADSSLPPIVRGSAALRLGRHLDAQLLPSLRELVNDPSSLVRYGAFRGLASAPPQHVLDVALVALEDPQAAVRHQAAWYLVEHGANGIPPAYKDRWQGMVDELWREVTRDADRPEGLARAALLHRMEGRIDQALHVSGRFTERAPYREDGWANLADLQREAGLNQEAITTLEQGIAALPESALLHHALGLALIRAKAPQRALRELKTAVQLAPEVPRFHYVYAVAATDLVSPAAGLKAYDVALQRFPGDRAFLDAKASLLSQMGQKEQAEALRRDMEPQRTSSQETP